MMFMLKIFYLKALRMLQPSIDLANARPGLISSIFIFRSQVRVSSESVKALGGVCTYLVTKAAQ